MRQYFKMESDIYADYGITHSPKLLSLSVLSGKIIDALQLPPLIFETDFPDDAKIPHFLTGGTVLASDLLLQTLRSAGIDNFQAFPITLVNKDSGKCREGFNLFNVIGLLSAANLSESTYDLLMEATEEDIASPLLAFTELKLKKDAIGGALMFRLAEDPTVLIVEEAILNVLVENCPACGWGIDLVEIED